MKNKSEEVFLEECYAIVCRMSCDDANPNFILAAICIIYTFFKNFTKAVDIFPICQEVFCKP